MMRAQTVSILFTDLVDSTAIRARLGEEQADELGRIHFQLLGTAVDTHGGRVVKGTGDGILAVFDSAADAIDAAITIQQQAHAYTASTDAIGPLIIRAGVSTGDITWDNNDIAGTAAIEAARLEAHAQPGQILCTDLTRLITRGRGGHTYNPIGDLELKGLPEPVPTSEVLWQPLDTRPTTTIALPDALRDTGRPFVARNAELDTISNKVEAAEATGPYMIWLSGEPGIGKTTLAAVAARKAHANGRTILFGRCDRQLRVPFRPFTEALDHWARHLDPAVTLSPDVAIEQLARISSQLASFAHTDPDRSGDQFALFEAVRRWLQVLDPILVIDDAQWASDTTIQLLGHLSRATDYDRTVILATLRSDEVPADLQRIIDDSVTRERGVLLNLGGLDEAAIAELTLDADPAALRVRTGGNPLFLETLAQHDLDTGTGTTIEAAVARRTEAVNQAQRDTLRNAAIIGLEFEAATLARCLGLTDVELLDRLEPCIAAGIVIERARNRFAFAHGLIQEALQAQLTETRRSLLHEKVARAMEDVGVESAAIIGYHFDRAGSTTKAIEFLEIAADDARSLGAAEEAALVHDRLAVLHPDIDQRLNHEHAALRNRFILGDFSREAYERRSAIARTALSRGHYDLYCQALLDSVSFAIPHGQSKKGDLPRLSADEIIALPTATQRVKGMVGLALAMIYFDGRHAEALALLESIEGDVGEARVDAAADYYNSLVWAMGPTRNDERIAAGRKSIALATDPLWSIGAEWWLLGALMSGGHMTEAYESLSRMTDRLRGRLVALFSYFALSTQVPLDLASGRLDAAAQATEAANRIMDDRSGFDAAGTYGLQKFAVLREMGRLHEIAPQLQLVARLDPIGVWRPGLAALYADQGMSVEAAQQLDRILADDDLPVPADSRYETVLAFMTDAAVASSHRHVAAHLLPLLEPYRDLHLTSFSVAYYGPATRYLAGLNAVLGNDDEAEALYRRSIEQCKQAPSPTFEARSHIDFAEFLEAHGRTTEATHHAAAALTLATTIGMATVTARSRTVIEHNAG